MKKKPSVTERFRSSREKKKEEDILEELCDVLPATLGPHPRVGVVVERGSHHVLLHFDAVLLALVAVVVRHVEPGKDQMGQRAESEVCEFHALKRISLFLMQRSCQNASQCLASSSSFLFLAVSSLTLATMASEISQ